MTTNTSTPLGLLRLPDKSELLAAFKGKKLSELRTPAAIVDRSVFTANSERVAKETKARGMGFRVHVKSTSRFSQAYPIPQRYLAQLGLSLMR